MARHMRIALVTTELAGATPYAAGIGTQYAGLASGLAAAGHDVVGIVSDQELVGEIAGVRLTRTSRGLRGTATPLGVALELRRHGPFDAVVCPEWQGECSAYALWRRSGPLLTHLNFSLDQWALDTPDIGASLRSRARRGWQSLRERTQALRSDALIAPSQAMLQAVGELWPIEGMHAEVVPNGIDVARVRKLGQGEPPSPVVGCEGPVVLYFGRIEERKGALDLAAAMRDVWAVHPEARLRMVGMDVVVDGRSTVARLLEMVGPDAGRVELLGIRSPEELFPLVAAADLVVLPSWWEAFGLTALEAMALGRPVVVTQGSGYDEFFRDGEDGIAVPVRDPEGLAVAVGELLADDERRARCGAAAAKRAEAFDSALLASRWVDLIEGLGSSPGGGPVG